MPRNDLSPLVQGVNTPSTVADVRKLIDELGIYATADFKIDGFVWVLGLDNAQTQALVGTFATAGNLLALLVGPAWPAIAVPLNSALGYIEVVNELGGRNGVEINGMIGAQGVIVTPRLGGLFGSLVHLARVEASGAALIALLGRMSGSIPALASALNIPVVAAICAQVAKGTPLGWAISGALGLGITLFAPEPDPNAHGAVMADRDEALEWESFLVGQLGDGNKVALLSWQGYFSAQMGGGHGVYANRPEVGPWETWTMIDNHDGSISLQTIDGHYLCAEMGGGRECQADRTSIGDWEKFELVALAGGRYALRTRVGRKFVSVQQNS